MVNEGGWIGVDLDGTLAEYHKWVAWDSFGKPIPKMVERIQGWLASGREVRIVTARIGLPVFDHGRPVPSKFKVHECRHTKVHFSDHDMHEAIADYTELHVGERLKVQCYKDFNMLELWDDRAVQVIPNTGVTIADATESELSALRGKP